MRWSRSPLPHTTSINVRRGQIEHCRSNSDNDLATLFMQESWSGDLDYHTLLFPERHARFKERGLDE